ncbi:MAG: deoxynucleoside kinase [Bacteroidetes bacterium]|nr:deoxynucleoside kinase [Bacteroidota bacterium]
MENLHFYNFVSIEGNIGAGKTSLATRIASQFNAKIILEQFEDNPFLPKFYEDPSKYAFPLELSFLAARYQQLADELTNLDLFKKFTVSDYFIHKSLVFSRKTLQQDEYNLYARLFSIMMNSLPKPDLLVYLYLETDQLQSNIRKRGRSYEQNISPDYLDNIQQSYFEHLKTLTDQRILILDTNCIDFVDNPHHYDLLINLIFKDYPKGIHRIKVQ